MKINKSNRIIVLSIIATIIIFSIKSVINDYKCIEIRELKKEQLELSIKLLKLQIERIERR